MTVEKKAPLSRINLPADYDYVACFMTDYCFLKCAYCITDHNDTAFTSGKNEKFNMLSATQWLEVFSRINFPAGVVPTLQGGEPFLHQGIWEIIENSPVPIDILTALPPVVKRSKFEKLKSLKSLSRGAPYPNVRVSYHIGQNSIEDLAPRVAELQDLFPIGIYLVDHPGHPEEKARAQEICDKHGVFFKTKEYLGYHDGKLYGQYFYEDSCVGHVTRTEVECRNTVLIISPSGDVYRCHSDLYHKRHELKVGNISQPNFAINDNYQPCHVFGLCSECDVKVKNNHLQQFGYTSAQIKFLDEPVKGNGSGPTGRASLRVV